MVCLQKKLNVARCQKNVLKLYLICIGLKRHKNSTADQMIMTSKSTPLRGEGQRKVNLSIGEKVYVLAERIKKKSAPGKFFFSVQNISYFNKEKIFIIRAIQLIGGLKYYWLKNSETNRKLAKRIMRTEPFALKSNFSM